MFKGKILNIHPALLPKFGGKGMYGHHVHKAVNQAIDMGSLTVIKGIGHENGFNFGGEPPRVLQNYEGLITKINFQ